MLNSPRAFGALTLLAALALVGCDRTPTADAATPARKVPTEAPSRMESSASPEVATSEVVPLPTTAQDPAPDASRTERTGQEIEGALLRDHDYAFEIGLPGRGWEFWPEERVRELNPDACLGLVNLESQAFIIVVAERLGEVGLTEFVDLILHNTPLQSAAVHQRKAIEMGGEPAVTVDLSGRIRGVDLRYLMSFVVHEGFHYQVLGWSLSSRFEPNRKHLERAVQSLRFAPGQKPRVRSTVSYEDDQDVDWRIRGTRYENAPFAFRLDCPEGWRFSGRTELAQMNSDASAGLICPDPQIYQIYVAEAVGTVNPEEHTRLATQMFQNNLGLRREPNRTEIVQVAGSEATEVVYRDVSLQGASFDMVFTFFYRGDLFYQVQTWWPSVEGELALARFRETYGAVSFLDETEQASLEEQLKGGDVQNAVGADFAFRGGVYQDFKHGFNYQLTPEIWRVKVGDQARQENPVAAMMLENPGRGIFGAVIPELIDDLPHREYHGILTRNLGAPRGVEVQSLPRAEGELKFSIFDLELDGVSFRYACVTAARGRRHVQLLFYGLKENLSGIEGLLPTLTSGLEIPETAPVAGARKGGRYVDARLGYSVAPAGKGWKVTTPVRPEVQSISSQVLLKKGDTICLALGICEPDVAEKMVVEGMLRSAPLRALELDPAQRKERSDTLAGIPAQRITMSGRQGLSTVTLDVWTARRGNTTYCYLVCETAGIFSSGGSAEKLKKYFSLLD